MYIAVTFEVGNAFAETISAKEKEFDSPGWISNISERFFLFSDALR